MEPIVISAVIALSGVLIVAFMQSRQNKAGHRAETTAAEVKGASDMTGKTLDTLSEMVKVQNTQISQLTDRLEEQSRQLNRCEEDKIELRKALSSIEITLARSSLLPDPPEGVTHEGRTSE